MDLATITENTRRRVGEDCGLGKIIKFDFGGDGFLRVDAASKPNVVDNQDTPADCTIKVSQSDFVEIAAGSLNPQMAFMTGKLRVEGDLSVAMQLGKILG